ncbi:MAG TPA: SAM-dependent methyltransferase [Nocardia sp.]|uniref:SAM-dependent methyltransferase n=1 Tax=Nocardia TaxID=1817 RepID=UPI0024537D7D|nr:MULTISPECIES: SAM-dependent methyltransferase [Nocardia]HLS79360.1 SAM-dependent methyltransferase [Nocardia sp.]
MPDGISIVDLRQNEPHSARIYDYFLGGKDWYEADRAAAEQIEQSIPNVRLLARTNREFMHRAIRFLAERGIRQFLDIGTGIPTEPNLHQVAQEIAPDARVVYADNDPIVLAHARALLVGTPEGRTEYLHADITEPRSILDAPQLRDTLDFSQPVALSVIALAHFVTGERIYDIIATLLEPLAPGSHLVMTHFSADADPEGVARTVNAYQQGGIPIEPRDKDSIARFFSDLELVEPGIVPIHRWRPTGVEPPKSYDRKLPGYAAVARKP